MNSSSVKVKCPMGQFKSLKLIFFKSVGQFDHEGQGQGHKFLEQSKTFRRSIHSSSLKVKFPKLKSCCIHKKSHKIFKFQGQFDLECQGQGHQFSNPSEIFTCSINSLSWKVKFKMVQCLTVNS